MTEHAAPPAGPGPRLVLGSSSARRVELLGTFGVPFEQRSPEIDESVGEGEDPVAYVERLARAKAAAVAAAEPEGSVVIGADTTVELDGVIFGKPLDAPDARRMLMALSGRVHHVHSAIAVAVAEQIDSVVVSTAVEIADVGAAAIEDYIATGEPFGKAGAYAIQGIGARLVSRVEGSVSAVVGLPLVELGVLLGAAGVPLPR